MTHRILSAVVNAVTSATLWLGLLEAWLGPPRRAPRIGRQRLRIDAFDRLMNWASQAHPFSTGFPGEAALIDRMVELYEHADTDKQSAIRARLADDLIRDPEQSNADTASTALRLAGRIPVPAARGRLLRTLTERRHAPTTRRPSPTEQNGNADDEPTIARSIRALGRLDDPSLRSVFVTLIERYAEPALWDASAWRVLYQAGWALCRLDPRAFHDEIPRSLRFDASFVRDVAREPAGRANVAKWFATLPDETAAPMRGVLLG